MKSRRISKELIAIFSLITLVIFLKTPALADLYTFDLEFYIQGNPGHYVDFVTGKVDNTNSDLLGVSGTPNGALLNNSSDGSISGLLPTSVYYLYAQGPSTFPSGTQAWFSYYGKDGSPSGGAWFDVSGSPGTFSLWNPRTPGVNNLYLGFAQGTADQVSGYAGAPGLGPDGANDIYLVVGIGMEPAAPVPVPDTLLLLSSGLAGLAGWRRLRKG